MTLLSAWDIISPLLFFFFFSPGLDVSLTFGENQGKK